MIAYLFHSCQYMHTSVYIFITELQKSKRVLFVSPPDSSATQSYYIYDNCKLSTLQSMIEERLGIPPSHQRLYTQGKLLSDDNQLASLHTESNIQLLMHLKGGRSNCEICNDTGEYKINVSNVSKIFYAKSVVIECTSTLVR